jgi:hypothetical protein
MQPVGFHITFARMSLQGWFCTQWFAAFLCHLCMLCLIGAKDVQQSAKRELLSGAGAQTESRGRRDVA